MPRPNKTLKELSLRKEVQHLRPSATLLINERSKELAANGKEIYRLGFGQSPFPVPSSVIYTLREFAGEKDYLPVKGLPQLREAVAQFNNRTLGIATRMEDVMIGPGSKELIFSAQLAFDGDLLLPSPSWVSYEPQANLVGKKVIWIDTKEEDRWRLTPENLEAACQTNPDRSKLLILNYPNNPTGVSYTENQMRKLATILRQYEILVIADEIYGEVHHNGMHLSLAKFYQEGTIISGGLSKWCGAGGWRLGTFTFPESYQWLSDAMAVIASETFSAVSAPIQYAAVTAFKGNPQIEDYLKNSRAILRSVGNYVYNNLSAIKVTMPAPEGGFYLFPNFKNHQAYLNKKGIFNSKDLCEQLLEDTGVALLPGVAFGRPLEELTTRLSFVDFDGKKALVHAERENAAYLNDDFVKKNCPKIIEAVQRMQDWLLS